MGSVVSTVRITLMVALLLSGCTAVQPRRTVSDTSVDCTPTDALGNVSEACANQVVEVSKDYRLYFIEYDDQGRPYADIPKFGMASRQASLFLTDLRHASKKSDGFTVIAFVHGWKHSSAMDDDNLRKFRVLLAQLARVERDALCQREVIGLYVGWRGAASHLGESFENLTFWSRKRAAEEVSDGTLTEVFASVDAIKRSSHGPTHRETDNIDCDNKATYVGHSFGGLAVTNALRDSLVRDIAQDRERMIGGEPPVRRDRDLVIAINPAVEGARFDPLFRISQAVRYPHYQAPRYVAITSIDDSATGTFFPIGRSINASTKRYPEGDKLGRDATVIAMGHDAQYITHDVANYVQLEQKPEQPPPSSACHEWATTGSYADRARIDLERARTFFASETFPSDGEPLVRFFCTHAMPGNTTPEATVLVVRQRNDGQNPYSPIWNLQTRSPTVKHHNDFNNNRLVEFLRQLYIESLFVAHPGPDAQTSATQSKQTMSATEADTEL